MGRHLFIEWCVIPSKLCHLNLNTETLVQGLWLYLDEEKQTARDMPRFHAKARSREDISESFFPSLESKTISTDTLILELRTPQQGKSIFALSSNLWYFVTESWAHEYNRNNKTVHSPTIPTWCSYLGCFSSCGYYLLSALVPQTSTPSSGSQLNPCHLGYATHTYGFPK